MIAVFCSTSECARVFYDHDDDNDDDNDNDDGNDDDNDDDDDERWRAAAASV